MRATAAWPVLLAGGCSQAPSQNVLGSFIPSWLLCAGLGVVAAVLVWRILIVLRVAPDVPAAPLVYVAFAATTALLAWLLLFGH